MTKEEKAKWGIFKLDNKELNKIGYRYEGKVLYKRNSRLLWVRCETKIRPDKL